MFTVLFAVCDDYLDEREQEYVAQDGESYGEGRRKGNVEKICRACRDPIDRRQERI